MVSDLKSLSIDRSLKSTPARRGDGGKWLLLFIFLVAGAGAVGYFFFWPTPSIAVQIMRVQVAGTGSAPDIALNATGYIVAAHKIELAPKVNGRAAWIGVDMGSKVKKGDILVRLEDEEFAAQVKQQQGQLNAAKAKLEELENGSRPQEIAQAKAEVDQAEADLTDAISNLARTKDLLKSKAVSQQALDDAQATYERSKAKVDSEQAAYDLVKAGPRKEQIAAQEAQVEQAQGYLDLVKVNLANTVIRAPVDGTILDRNVEVGEYVTTGFVGDKGAKGYVVSIADLSDLRVELDISQNDFNKISATQHCYVTTDAYPDRHYDGAIDQISPEANRQKATILVKIKILEPDDLLRPDMNASVTFQRAAASTEPSTQASVGVVVPNSAVQDGDVFVVDAGKAVRRAVGIGQSSSGGIRILSGLAAGELLIVNPPSDLQTGRAVRALESNEGKSR